MRSNLSRPWTHQDEQDLTAMAAKNLPSTFMANRLKRTPRAISARIKLLRDRVTTVPCAAELTATPRELLD